MSKQQPYRICNQCIMDTSDPAIEFDGSGRCNHCHQYDQLVVQFVSAQEERSSRLEGLVHRIKKAGRGHDYDCIIGLSGGVDSSYVARLVSQDLGLRPLALHMDNGWNSNLAVSNIERIVNQLGIDLYTEVLDWDEFRDLQRSFLRASTPDSEIPTDHAITAVLMRQARIHGIKYVIGGSNITSEAIMPAAWSQGIRDWRYIAAVQKQFGTVPLETYPHFSVFRFAYNKLRGQRWVNILDYVEYRKTDVIPILEDELGWEPYETKHGESMYTRFFQNYILPTKFGYDKRRAHLSCLVCSGEIDRDEALESMENPSASAETNQRDLEFVAKKLGLSITEFQAIMELPPKTMFDYPNYESTFWHEAMRKAYRAPRLLRRLRR